MAMKCCLYCGVSISESALTCPSCKTAAPLDGQKKIADELQVKMKLEAEKEASSRENIIRMAHQKEYQCSECGDNRALEMIFKDRTCPKCGYPDSRPKCNLCTETAVRFDEKRLSLVCDKHFVEICAFCKKPIEDGKKYVHRWTEVMKVSRDKIFRQAVFHNKCWNKRNSGCSSSFAIILVGASIVALKLIYIT